MMQPILLSTEGEVLGFDMVRDSDPSGVFNGFLDGRPWNPVTVEPPHNVTIELQCGYARLDGFAHRRVLGGSLTFWARFGLSCRYLEPRGWRLKA